MISTKFFTRIISAESTGDFFLNIVFSPLLVAIFNFCIKRKKLFISEMERDRAISTYFLTRRLSADLLAIFS